MKRGHLGFLKHLEKKAQWHHGYPSESHSGHVKEHIYAKQLTYCTHSGSYTVAYVLIHTLEK